MGIVQPTNQQSEQWRISPSELKSWAKWSLIMVSPAILTFLTALQSGISLKLATGMLVQGMLGIGIYLFKKLQES